MGNKQISQSSFSLKLLQKVDNLSLNGNVQCGDWLITNDKIRIHCKCTGDTNSLALSAGELMRETVCMLCLQSNCLKKLQDLVVTLFLIRCKAVGINSLCYNIQNLSSWVQGCIWILENHLHSSAKLMSLLLIQILVNL